MGRFCIGIDLGGTFIKSALLDEAMAIQAELQSPTAAERGPDGVIETMASDAERLIQREGLSRQEVAGVGIGSPGPLDLEAGVVLGTPNLPGFENVPLRSRLSDRLEMPVALENDANAAALGEYLVGGGAGARIMVLLTLGTGVGSGIVIDGRLLHGAHGIGAELGHLIVEPDGETCGCGQRGCLERYASATYMAQYARRLIEEEGRDSSLAGVLAEKGDLDAADVSAACRAGDALAREVWDRSIRFLAIGCVGICRVLDPDTIVLGGGMTKAGDGLMGPLLRHFVREHWTLTEPKTTLALGRLGNRAGVVGAAGVAWEQFGT